MKRLAATAMLVACVAWTASAQRGGGSHGGSFGGHGGGFGGSHSNFGGFSAPLGGFSGPHVAMPAPRSGFPGLGSTRPYPGGSYRFAGPPRSMPGTIPYRGMPGGAPYRYAPGTGPSMNRLARPGAPVTSGPRMPYQPRMPYSALASPRAPYHSPNGGNHNNWYYGGYHYHNGWYHSGFHYHVGFCFWGGVPLWYGWGYPYLPGYMYYPGLYSYYYPYYDDPTPQPYADPSAGPYNPPPDQTEPEAPPSYTPWPNGSSTPPPSSEPPSSAAVSETAPVTLVFKDRRPAEQIHNYLLTPRTLSVLDQHRRDIPIDQIDLPATAEVNREAGVEFTLPGSSR